MHGTAIYPQSRLRHCGTPIADAVNVGITAICLAALLASIAVACLLPDAIREPTPKLSTRVVVQEASR